MRSSYNNGDSNESLRQAQNHLQEKMQSAGFSRFCGEWWHFEGVPMSRACDPGEY